MAGVGRCIVTTIYAARRPAGNLGVAYNIVRCDLDGAALVQFAAPPVGRSFTRPIVSSSGRVAWWEVEQGGSHDSPWSMFAARWWVDGVIQPRPKGWLACGHLEWHPDGRRMVAAVWEWWTADFRPWIFADGKWTEIRSREFGEYDPSYGNDGRLVTARKRGSGYVVDLGATEHPVPGGQTFDPAISPDGQRCAVLVMETAQRWRIDLIDLADGTRSTVLAARQGDLNSAPRWIDNDRLLVCRCLPDDAWTWRPWIVPADGRTPTACWSAKAAQAIGSVEYAFPVAS